MGQSTEMSGDEQPSHGSAPGVESPLAAAPEPVADPRLKWVLAACCTVVFAKLVDPQAWMMGLDSPVSAFGAAWSDYRAFSAVNRSS